VISRGVQRQYKKNGKGVYYYANGDKREGHWKNNQRHGHAIFYLKDGRKYREKWDDGKKLESVLIE
jgi:antitoxin component YwqK of YwqJK toxin-antitoxin module